MPMWNLEYSTIEFSTISATNKTMLLPFLKVYEHNYYRQIGTTVQWLAYLLEGYLQMNNTRTLFLSAFMRVKDRTKARASTHTQINHYTLSFLLPHQNVCLVLANAHIKLLTGVPQTGSETKSYAWDRSSLCLLWIPFYAEVAPQLLMSKNIYSMTRTHEVLCA